MCGLTKILKQSSNALAPLHFLSKDELLSVSPKELIFERKTQIFPGPDRARIFYTTPLDEKLFPYVEYRLLDESYNYIKGGYRDHGRSTEGPIINVIRNKFNATSRSVDSVVDGRSFRPDLNDIINTTHGLKKKYFKNIIRKMWKYNDNEHTIYVKKSITSLSDPRRIDSKDLVKIYLNYFGIKYDTKLRISNGHYPHKSKLGYMTCWAGYNNELRPEYYRLTVCISDYTKFKFYHKRQLLYIIATLIASTVINVIIKFI